MQTYGIFGLTFKTATIKTDNDAGRVLDAKYKFATGVRAERRFMLEHVPVLKGAAQEGGKLRLEVTPMMDGQAFPAVDVPVILRGNITIDEAGDVLVNLRVQFSELDNAGLGVDTLLTASCCLECRVSNQPTLDEQIRTELKAEKQVQEDVDNLLKDTQPLLPPANIVLDAPTDNSPAALLARCSFGQLSSLLQAIGRSPADWADPSRTDEEDAAEWREVLLQEWDALLATGVPAHLGLVEATSAPEEDMPFPTGSDDFGTQPSA